MTHANRLLSPNEVVNGEYTTVITSRQDGRYEDPDTWEGGVVPTGRVRAVIRHRVAVPVFYIQRAAERQAYYDMAGCAAVVTCEPGGGMEKGREVPVPEDYVEGWN